MPAANVCSVENCTRYVLANRFGRHFKSTVPGFVLGDLAKYAAFHMVGERGESKLLKAESFKKLHTAVGGDVYALG